MRNGPPEIRKQFQWEDTQEDEEKKKKKKKKKADDIADGHFKKALFEGSIEDSKPTNEENGIIKLTGLKSILDSKREDKFGKKSCR